MKSESKEKCVKFLFLPPQVLPLSDGTLLPSGEVEKGLFFWEEVQSFVCPKSTNTKMLVKITLVVLPVLLMPLLL